LTFPEEGKQVGLLSEVRNPAGSVPKELLDHGLLGRAVIVSVQQTPLSTGSEDDPLHVCVFTIEVALAGMPRFTATCRQAVAASLLPKLMLSDVAVPVRVDPDDRSYVALSFGEQLPAIWRRSSGRSQAGAGLSRVASEAA
jgi:hypothetical protein